MNTGAAATRHAQRVNPLEVHNAEVRHADRAYLARFFQAQQPASPLDVLVRQGQCI